jgi:uncharacterized protein (DUF1697 family)
MSRYAAFLRGMNLGGRRLTNAELQDAFRGLGLAEVATFRASGNVAFAAAEQPLEELEQRIEEGLLAALGYEVPTFLRTDGEIHAIAAHRPFPAAAVGGSGGKLQVGMLPRAPAAAARRAVLGLADARDRLAFAARELYWLPSGGISDSELDLKAIERQLGAMTLRTKGTVEQMAGKLFAA